MNAMWGIHNDRLTTELIDGGFISIGWEPLPDLRSLGPSREELKSSLAQYYPDSKPATLANWAGTLLRFRDEMQVGDVVVAPYRPDSTVNIGVITGDYYFDTEATVHPHRREVEWKRLGLPRGLFSQQARYELGSLLTVFALRKNADEFHAVLAAEGSDEEVARVAEAAAESSSASSSEPDPADELRASRIRQHTRDFILERLLRGMDHEEFEEFTADLLRALGYQARATPFTRDGGVDVIAHRDPLGVEPPLIKVQCKHLTSTVGAPDLHRLIGTLGPGELAVFVTLGNYSPDAVGIARSKPGVRLLTGDDVVDLVIANYPQLSSKWRALIPLTPVLVVDDAADA